MLECTTHNKQDCMETSQHLLCIMSSNMHGITSGRYRDDSKGMTCIIGDHLA